MKEQCLPIKMKSKGRRNSKSWRKRYLRSEEQPTAVEPSALSSGNITGGARRASLSVFTRGKWLQDTSY
ncbi:hypothetical protein QYF36_019225 [Acer negundo]|nr:hypothetical protein QYF36_019225 [Acer negundo]